MHNNLFFTNDVRDYIKELFNNRKLSTKAISYKFYLELCHFFNIIRKFEITDRKKTIQKLLLHILCNGNKNDRLNTFNFFIDNLKTIDIEKSIKNIIFDIKDELIININKNNSKESCKNEINEILNKYFKSLKFKQFDITEHDIIKNKINDSNHKDIELFMNFFNYVECIDNQCEIYNITDKNNPKSKLNLIKNEKDKILLLELFNGIDVQLVLSQNDELKFNTIELEFDKVFENKLKKVCNEYAQKFEDEYNKSEKNIIIQDGGIKTGEFSGLILLPVFGFIYASIYTILLKIGFKEFLKSNFAEPLLFLSSGALTIYIFFFLPDQIDKYEQDLYVDKNDPDFLNKIKNKKLVIFIYKSILNIAYAASFATILYFGKISENNQINFYGGENKCYIIENLKINLVNKFLLFSIDNKNNIKIIEKCDKIKLDNKQYLLSGYSDYGSLDCLHITHLFKNNKFNGGKKYKIIKFI